MADLTLRARSLLKSLKTSMATGPSVHRALAPSPVGDDSVPGECMDAKYFSGASNVRDGAAEVLKTLARRAALALLAIVATAMAANAQGADAFPARPITLVVPFAPSGGNDIMARLVGERMGKVFGQQIVVENRPGAGGNIGSRQAARSAPDGYTMLLA